MRVPAVPRYGRGRFVTSSPTSPGDSGRTGPAGPWMGRGVPASPVPDAEHFARHPHRSWRARGHTREERSRQSGLTAVHGELPNGVVLRLIRRDGLWIDVWAPDRAAASAAVTGGDVPIMHLLSDVRTRVLQTGHQSPPPA